jgi:death on curing protein
MISVDVEDIIKFQKKIVLATGGSYGIRDRSLIESALNKAFVTFEGTDLCSGVLKKISIITYTLIENHGFIDGNKRIGVSTMLLLLRLNEIRLYSKRVSRSWFRNS